MIAEQVTQRSSGGDCDALSLYSGLQAPQSLCSADVETRCKAKSSEYEHVFENSSKSCNSNMKDIWETIFSVLATILMVDMKSPITNSVTEFNLSKLPVVEY